MDLGQSCCALAQPRLWSLCCLVLLLPGVQLCLGGMGRGSGSGHGADGQNPRFPTVFPPKAPSAAIPQSLLSGECSQGCWGSSGITWPVSFVLLGWDPWVTSRDTILSQLEAEPPPK